LLSDLYYFIKKYFCMQFSYPVKNYKP